MLKPWEVEKYLEDPKAFEDFLDYVYSQVDWKRGDEQKFRMPVQLVHGSQNIVAQFLDNWRIQIGGDDDLPSQIWASDDRWGWVYDDRSERCWDGCWRIFMIFAGVIGDMTRVQINDLHTLAQEKQEQWQDIPINLLRDIIATSFNAQIYLGVKRD